jgi:prophage antirepressor-like protein
VASDALGILGLDRTAFRRLDEDEKGVASIHTPGGKQEVTTINEPGLYALVLGSRKPGAKDFKRWITHEVLPTLRRTGTYEIAPQSEDEIVAKALQITAQRVEKLQAALDVAQPRAEAWDAIASAEGDYSVGDAAKILARAGIQTGPARLFAQLQILKWTYRGADSSWRAYAERVEKGYLAEKPQFHYHPGTGERVIDPPQVRITVKGIERLRQRLHGGDSKAVAA